MLNLTLGFFIGIATSSMVFTILAYFRVAIERRVTIIEKKLGNAGPQPRGAIIMPEEEADVLRNKIIEKNRARGKDTHIDELR